jgi:hypothetical protein
LRSYDSGQAVKLAEWKDLNLRTGLEAIEWFATRRDRGGIAARGGASRLIGLIINWNFGKQSQFPGVNA